MNKYDEFTVWEKFFLISTFLIIFLVVFQPLVLIPNNQRNPDDYHTDYQTKYQFCDSFEQQSQTYDCQQRKFDQIFPNQEQFDIWLEDEIPTLIEMDNNQNFVIGSFITIVVAIIGTMILFLVFLVLNVVVQETIFEPIRLYWTHKQQKEEKKVDLLTRLRAIESHTRVVSKEMEKMRKTMIRLESAYLEKEP